MIIKKFRGFTSARETNDRTCMKYYLAMESISRMADEMNYNESHVKKLHRDALAAFQIEKDDTR